MAIKIRQSTFETNSSSVHSIVIDTRNMIEPSDISIYSNGGKYGWEYEMLSTINERVDYLWQGICQNYDPSEALYEWRDAIHEWLPNANLEYPKYPDGYIDHAGGLYPLLKRMYDDRTLLGCYLLGIDSYVETYNDNEYNQPEDVFTYPEGDGYVRYEKWN